MFAVPFDEIALMLERSPAATRQLARRARRPIPQEAAPQIRNRADRAERQLATELIFRSCSLRSRAAQATDERARISRAWLSARPLIRADSPSCWSDQAAGPGAMECRVPTGATDEVSGRAVLDDSAGVDDHDAVSDLDGGQAVGDDDCGPFGKQRLQRVLDKTLRRHVE